jgi:hypothetical protein
MSQDSNKDAEGIKGQISRVQPTDEETCEAAFQWLAELKEKIAIYTGELKIPHAVSRLLIKHLPESWNTYCSVMGSCERHDAKVSPSITSQEKAEMRELRQEIYDECNYLFTKICKAQNTKSHTPDSATMSALGKAAAKKRWESIDEMVELACKVAEEQYERGSKKWHNKMAKWILGKPEFESLERYPNKLRAAIGDVAAQYGMKKGVKIEKS